MMDLQSFYFIYPLWNLISLTTFYIKCSQCWVTVLGHHFHVRSRNIMGPNIALRIQNMHKAVFVTQVLISYGSIM